MTEEAPIIQLVKREGEWCVFVDSEHWFAYPEGRAYNFVRIVPREGAVMLTTVEVAVEVAHEKAPGFRPKCADMCESVGGCERPCAKDGYCPYRE